MVVTIQHNSRRRGFTLLELLIVIAIVAVLAVILIVILNPLEILAQGRDGSRLSDFTTLKTVLGVYRTEISGGSMGSASTTYISVPDSIATSSAGDQCQGLTLPILPSGWNYHCAASSSFASVDGTGWIPVNLASLTSGPPISGLPIDPVNNDVSGLYYTYTTNGSQYELTAPAESQKYQARLSTDGGKYADLYEYGTKLSLAPLDFKSNLAVIDTPGLLAYWNFEEGSGSSTADLSGNGNTGTWIGTAGGTNGTYYTTGRVGTYAGFFDGNTTAVTLLNQTLDMGTNDFSVSAWIKTPSNSAYTMIYSKGCCGLVGYDIGVDASNRFDLGMDSVSNQHWFGTVVADNSWHFVAVSVARGGLARFYLDGVANATGSVIAQSSTISNSTTGTIGSFRGTSSFFNGSIDDVRIYNRAISAAEVQAIYSAQK